MKISTRKGRLVEPYFEMTPMMDIILQLNIFFMCTIHFGGMNVSADLRLPKAEFAIPPEGTGGSRVIFNYTKDGQWIVSNNHLEGLKEVEDLLKREKLVAPKAPDGTPDLTIVVRADKMAPYEHIRPLIEACARNGIYRVAFMAVTPQQPVAL